MVSLVRVFTDARLPGSSRTDYPAGMLDVSCLCGDVRLRAAKLPEFVNDCNCKLCSKTGARWAYYQPDEVVIEGATSGFVRRDKGEAGADVRFCPTCGSTTHFVLTPGAVAKHGNVMMGLNSRLADDAALAGVEVRYPDGRAWPGQGELGYRRPAEMIGVVQPT